MSKGFKSLAFKHLPEEEIVKRSLSFFEWMDQRRSVREFSDKAVPKEVIENIVKTASTAPSGAHKQPWTFCVVSNTDLKQKIREAAEKEEYENYNGRMSEEWLKDLAVFQTNWEKEFLTKAPYLIIVFRQSYGLKDGQKQQHYYTQESVGIAAGMLITAIHNAGLVTLTHTPSPMNFLANLLGRPANEKAYLLLPVGYPAETCEVPNLERKALSDVAVFYD